MNWAARAARSDTSGAELLHSAAASKYSLFLKFDYSYMLADHNEGPSLNDSIVWIVR